MADDQHDETLPPPDAWNIQKSAELYQISGWGKPYFNVNEAGHVSVTPDPRKECNVDLYELTVQLGARGVFRAELADGAGVVFFALMTEPSAVS